MKAIQISILALFSIAAYGQTKTGPGKILIDNAKVSVVEFESQPGKDVCGLGTHAHPAHLTVLLTDATVTVTLANGKTATQKLPAGTTFWSDAETHTVINSGNSVARAQIIEPKK